MRQYEIYEKKWKAEKNSEEDVGRKLPEFVFFHPVSGKEKHIKCFKSGENEFCMRFFPEEQGWWEYKVMGEIEESGSVFFEPKDQNKHGVVRVIGKHFEYQDGTTFYPIGTTIYALLHQKKELYEQTFETLKNGTFNKVRFCIFPKYYDWNRNDPLIFPFEKTDGKWDTKKPCYAYWDFLDVTLNKLDSLGIQADLILFHPYDRWGFSKFTREEAIEYLDYAVNRLSSHQNIWWSLANEYDLLDYELEDWNFFADYITKKDVYGHLLSNHNAIHFWDFANKDTTHICVQTTDIRGACELASVFQKPVIIDECGYEGNLEFNWGNLSGEEMTENFWIAVSRGAYCTHGETFLNAECDDEVLWWSKGGELKGDSWKRIKFLRSILESLPGPLEFVKTGYAQYSLEEIGKIAEMSKEMRPKEFQAGQYTKGLLHANKEEILRIQSNGRLDCSHYKDEVFLYYLGRRCPSSFTMELPIGNTYIFQLIDTWKMTCDEVKGEKVKIEESQVRNKGNIWRIHFPSKPYLAILARKIEEKK